MIYLVCPQKRPDWALFASFLSTLVCCQPTELILGFFVSYFFLFYPPPQLRLERRLMELVASAGEMDNVAGWNMLARLVLAYPRGFNTRNPGHHLLQVC